MNLPRKIPAFFFLLFFAAPSFAQYEGEWRLRPQIGLWFGPVTPVPGTEIADAIGTNLGGGLFFRINLPSNAWRTELGTSYSVYTSKGPEQLMSIPVYLAEAYTLPINLPLTFQVKGGFGGNYVQNQPEVKHNWLPAMLLGSEMSFPAGKWVNIGLRIDYFFVYEKHVSPPADFPDFKLINGHFLNFGLMVNFNLAR